MKRFFNILTILFIIYLLLSLVIGIESSFESENIEGGFGQECEEYTIADSLNLNNVSLTHLRSWSNYYYDSIFCLSYELSRSTTTASRNFRNGFNTREPIYENYWRNVYYELYQHDTGLIDFLKDSLSNIAVRNSLTRPALANLLVSFVQDIPYNYVLPGDCINKDRPCIPNEKFGILSPLEFLYSLSGDCDTRSVLLYALLKHFEFDPLIVISNEYRHAMIALDIPASGDFILHKGRKFYFWETTNVGWLPAILPPGVNNIQYWKITLDHEYTPIAASNR